ncbi:lipopolysaccharide-induced tumor necrosis factor-alpha factor homolog [Colossoma macropomum]|uniref:lipopolysaccharide-induced tumor necrosis factor-alpha factor homolog n=1 Tax=Colossoma macropomum TaxID=42526 RepID=UPI001865172C|nr:lipopolysaccharide-induced tumor necrosis factor-alpha factor homolog [Colossoma macropomum]
MDDPLYEEVPDHPEIKVIQPAPTPAVIQTQVQPEVTVIQPAPPTTVIQTQVQPEVTVVQPAPPTPVIQTQVQPEVTVVQPEPVPAVVQPAVQQAVVVNSMVSKPNLTDIPGQFRCPVCQLDVVTVIRFLTDTTVACNLFGSHCSFTIWPCCLVPFHSCHDVEHTCPNCKNVLYIYKRN